MDLEAAMAGLLTNDHSSTHARADFKPFVACISY